MIPAFPNVYTLKVSFPGLDVASDMITGLDTAIYGAPGIGIPVLALVANNPSFWIQQDTDGKDHLCTTKTTAGPMVLHFLTGPGPMPRNKTACNFRLEYFDERNLPVWLPVAQA